jgi:hypothetical protein
MSAMLSVRSAPNTAGEFSMFGIYPATVDLT